MSADIGGGAKLMGQSLFVAGFRLRRFVLAVIGVSISGCYVSRQAWHQGLLLKSRRSVSDVVDDPNTNDETREKLTKVKSVLAFAAKVRLNTDGAYEYFIQTDKPVVSYLVQAAPATKMELLTWWFPIVGNVPYLGFYERSERDEEAARLKSDGLDVALTGAGAFSSLGWFNDPIFSSMLLRRDSDLAHLFFHELTHRTFWVPNAANFNENLAEYVAVILTRDYLASISDKDGLIAYEQRRDDKAKFSEWLISLRSQLQALYAEENLSLQQKLAKKTEILAAFQKAPKRPRFRQVDLVAGEAWNNASILGASLYVPDFEAFDRVRRCLGNPPIRDFLDKLKMAVESGADDPMTSTVHLCRAFGGSEAR